MSGLNERTKRQIALLAGDDLEDDDVEEIRRLIAICPDCRRYWERIRGCLDVLDCNEASDPSLDAAGLWPSVESQMRSASPRPRQFNGWVPALSMAAACIAMLVAGQMDRSWRPDGNGRFQAEQTSVGSSHVRWIPIQPAPSDGALSTWHQPPQVRNDAPAYGTTDFGTAYISTEPVPTIEPPSAEAPSERRLWVDWFRSMSGR